MCIRDRVYTVCSFCEEDPIEKMFEQCDIQIWCESDEGELILHYENRHIRISIDNPFENDHTEDFRELLGSQNTILDTENTNIEDSLVIAGFVASAMTLVARSMSGSAEEMFWSIFSCTSFLRMTTRSLSDWITVWCSM